MVKFERVLLATDFSDSSHSAVEHAVTVAKQFGAALHVLYVLDTDVPIMPDAISYLPLNYFQDLEKHAAEKVEQVVDPEDRSLLKLTSVVRKGIPFLEIVRYAAEEKMDLIVMGTHGRGAFAHAFIGSVAEKVVRTAPCAVLTIRNPKHAFAMP